MGYSALMNLRESYGSISVLMLMKARLNCSKNVRQGFGSTCVNAVETVLGAFMLLMKARILGAKFCVNAVDESKRGLLQGL